MTFAKILHHTLICGLLACAVAPAAHAIRVPGMDKLIKTIKEKEPKEACKKGSLFSRTTTIRSYEGSLCLDKGVAAWAEETCPKVASDYEDSKCHKNAERVLAGEKPLSVLMELVKEKATPAQEIICGASKLNEKLKIVQDKACPK